MYFLIHVLENSQENLTLLRQKFADQEITVNAWKESYIIRKSSIQAEKLDGFSQFKDYPCLVEAIEPELVSSLVQLNATLNLIT